MGTGLKVTTFKERFADLFEESKKTTTQLAKDLRVSNQTISAWKTGERSPKEPTIISIANYFNVKVEWLLGFDVEREAPKRPMLIQDAKVLNKLLNAMTPSEYSQFTELLDKVGKRLKEKGEL